MVGKVLSWSLCLHEYLVCTEDAQRKIHPPALKCELRYDLSYVEGIPAELAEESKYDTRLDRGLIPGEQGPVFTHRFDCAGELLSHGFWTKVWRNALKDVHDGGPSWRWRCRGGTGSPAR